MAKQMNINTPTEASRMSMNLLKRLSNVTMLSGTAIPSRTYGIVWAVWMYSLANIQNEKPENEARY